MKATFTGQHMIKINTKHKVHFLAMAPTLGGITWLLKPILQHSNDNVNGFKNWLKVVLYRGWKLWTCQACHYQAYGKRAIHCPHHIEGK